MIVKPCRTTRVPGMDKWPLDFNPHKCTVIVISVGGKRTIKQYTKRSSNSHTYARPILEYAAPAYNSQHT